MTWEVGRLPTFFIAWMRPRRGGTGIANMT
jgi:hypothetical protein